jgi:hypothetical protein
MNKKKDISFKSLVKLIDKKWGHTYVDVPVVEEDKQIPETKRTTT